MKKILSLLFMVGLLISPKNADATLISDFNEISGKLNTIGQALHNYHSVYRVFPWEMSSNAFTPGPAPNLSWRVALLPFIGEQALYNQFDLSLAWNVGVNATLLSQMPDIYRGPGDALNSSTTRFAGVAGQNTIFEGPDGTRISEITDGTSNTLMVGEVFGSNIAWTQPEDIDVGVFSTLGSVGGFNSSLGSVVPFLVADTSICAVSSNTSAATLSNLFLMNDGAGSPSCVSLVPESSSLALIGLGLFGLCFSRRSGI